MLSKMARATAVAGPRECLVYTVQEAGEMVGLGRNAAYEAARRGDIPTIRIGKLLKVPKAAFHRLIEKAEPGSQR